MFSSLHAPKTNRSRSKSPGAPVTRSSKTKQDSDSDDRKYRKKSSRSKHSESESEEDPYRRSSRAPQYEDRTPDAYSAKPKSSRRRKEESESESDENDKYASRKYAAPDAEKGGRSRKERDVYDYDEPVSAKSPRGSYSGYTNGDMQYAAFEGNGSVPGGFPGQSVKPPPSPRAAPQTSWDDVERREAAQQAAIDARNRRHQSQYENAQGYQYAQVDPNAIQYTTNGSRQPSFSKAYDAVDSRPAATRQASDDKRKSIAESGRRQSYHRERSRSPAPGSSADQLRKSLGRLSTSSVGGMLGVAATPHTAGGKPPASPLLEAYRGTYQTISPLPSPQAMLARRRDDDDMSDFDLSEEEEDSDEEYSKKMKELKRQKQLMTNISPRSSNTKMAGGTKKSSMALTKVDKKKNVSFYDPDADAERIADALKGTHRAPEAKPLLKILPWLTTDEITTLKTAYKNYAKINGQGINLSKHIKIRFPGNPGNLGKILYATSLGRYESEAYWANCFYQSGAARRELLIESLTGRSNETIHQIKDVFKDKKYEDDIEKCMQKELKADKFRFAILLALEARRQPDGLGIDMREVHEDGQDLRRALKGEGGESAMIKIIMLRSDDHLREVMRYYDKSYRTNFAREMIMKSQNLVVSPIFPRLSVLVLTSV